MRVVTRFEEDLIRILECFFDQEEPGFALGLLGRYPRPPGLCRDAVELIQERLAKGCVRYLARDGGWQSARHLRGDQAVQGRLWERSTPEELQLSFSSNALQFLVWVTAETPKKGKKLSGFHLREITVADLLLFYLAYRKLLTSNLAQPLRTWGPIEQNGLCRLAHPEDFDIKRSSPAPDFSPWMQGPGASIMEALQLPLAERWLQIEQSKVGITDGKALHTLGGQQEVVLNPLLDAMEAAGRLDLGRFLLKTLAKLLGDDAGPDQWINRYLQAGTRMADRLACYHAALILVRQLERFERWKRQAWSVGYFDEGYAAAQLFKVDWERWEGNLLAQRAQRIIREVDPFNAEVSP